MKRLKRSVVSFLLLSTPSDVGLDWVTSGRGTGTAVVRDGATLGQGWDIGHTVRVLDVFSWECSSFVSVVVLILDHGLQVCVSVPSFWAPC